MYIEGILDIIKITIVYLLLILGYSHVVFSPVIKVRNGTERFFSYLILGNVFIIGLVYILAFLNIYTKIVLIAVMFLLGVGIRYYLEKEIFINRILRLYEKFNHVLNGEYGIKLLINSTITNVFKTSYRSFKGMFKGQAIDIILFIGTLGYGVYYYSYNSLRYKSFGAPDEEVHLFWIQALLQGNMFPSGVYPFGFHNIISALSLISGIHVNKVINLFGAIIILMLLVVLYLGLRSVIRYQIASVVGVMIYTFANIFVMEAIYRFQFAIPQEYGMLVLIPMIFFLFRFLQYFEKKDLLFFGLSFSLTISFHFYLTIIALVFCLGIGIVYFYRIIKKKLLLTILMAGILSVMLAVTPFGVALAQGIPLEQSMTWALGIISGDSYNNDEIEENEEVVEVYEEESLYDKVVENFTKYVVNSMIYIYIIALLILVTIVYNICVLFTRPKDDRHLQQLSLSIIMILMLFLILCRPLGLPTIMETKRVAIFFAVMSSFIWIMPMEIINRLFTKMNISNLSLLVWLAFVPTLGVLGINYDLIKVLPPFYYIQTTGAMIMDNHLISQYQDFKWTIISPVNDISTVMNNGYHLELSEFIIRQENWNNQIRIEVPTKYIFIYIEKRPLIYYGNRFYQSDKAITNRPFVSYNWANESLEKGLINNEYYLEYRRILMSKAYYWAITYKEYFPNEMSVYYEDEELIVYRIVQNEYAVNNLAINYELNDN